MEEDLRFKLVLIGDGGVGKTSIRRRFMGEKFLSSHLMTLGVDFSSKTTKIALDEIKYSINFSIWDVGGQKMFDRIRHRFFTNTSAILLVFDITRKESFDNLFPWLHEIWQIQDNQNKPIMIIANKIDLEESRMVKSDWVLQFIKNLQTQYPQITYCDTIETSALSGQNIDKLFETIAISLIGLADSK